MEGADSREGSSWRWEVEVKGRWEVEVKGRWEVVEGALNCPLRLKHLAAGRIIYTGKAIRIAWRPRELRCLKRSREMSGHP